MEMKRNKISMWLLIILTAGCYSVTTNKTEAQTTKEFNMNDTTPRVTGIGGIFFKSQNPKGIKEWYGKNLGLLTDEYGSINNLIWNPFSEKTKYFAPSKKEFMINYRVQNLVGLVRKLKENGVTIVDSMEVVEYGKFIHIMDPDGNKIELWEPTDSLLTKKGGATKK